MRRHTVELVIITVALLSGASSYAQTKWPPDDVRPGLTSLTTEPADVIVGEPVMFIATASTCPVRKDAFCVPLTDSRCGKSCNDLPPTDSRSCPTSPFTLCFDGRCVDPNAESRYCSGDCLADPCAPRHYAFDPGDGTCPPDQPFCLGFGTSHVYRNVGPYRIRARASNDAGTSSVIELVVNPREVRPPSVDFTWNSSLPPVSEIVGNGIPFRSDGLTQNGVREYLWDFGDGTTSTEPNPSHAFPAADSYVVSLTATNKFGRTTARKEISIGAKSGGTPPDAASFEFSPALVVTGQQVRFTDRSTGRILRWRWMFETTLGDSSLIDKAISYEQNPTHVYSTPMRKNVELWVSNEYGRKGILLFVDVIRSDSPPIAAFSFSPVSVTVGVPVQFKDESGGATSWLWDFGEDGATSTEQNPRHTYRSPGQKAVTLRVSNAFGNDTATKFFACSEGDVPSRLEALFIWSPTIPRPFEEVQFFDQSTGSPERWSWTVSDGSSSNERNWTHRFAQEGDYIVGLRVDKGSATHQFSQLVRVRSGAAPVARFNWAPVSPNPGQEVRFENESQNASAFSWDFGDGRSSTEKNPVHVYGEARTYSVKLAARNGEGDEHTLTRDLVVGGQEERPAALFDVSPNPAKAGRPVQFTDRSTGRPTRWYWTFGHSGATSNLQNPTYTFSDTGTYTVTLVVENSVARSEERGIGVIVKTAAKPVARFTWTPVNPKIGDSVVFTDQSENDPTDWRWTFPGGVTARGRQVSHVFNTRGRFDVTLEAVNDEGSGSLTQQVTVGEDLLVDFTISPEQPIVGKKTTFTDTTRGSFDSREWIIDGIVRERGGVLDYVFAADGLHTVELRVYRGSESSFRQKQFEVAGPPLAVITYQGEVVAGREVTFNSGTKGVVTGYAWTINGAPAGTSRSAKTTFMRAGRSSVTLRVQNAAGSDTHTLNVDVRSRPSTQRPNITKKEHVRYGPCLFEDRKGLSPETQDYSIGVFWRGFTPGEIVTTVDGDDRRTYRTRATGESTAVKVPMVFDASLKPAETHTIAFSALGVSPTDGTPEASDPEVRTLTRFRVPDDLSGNAFGKLEEDRRIAYTYTTAIPAREIEFTRDMPKEVPLFGGYKFGLTKTQWRSSHIFRTDCTSDSRTEAEGGITMGGGTISVKGYGKGGYEISQKDGIRQKKGSAVGWELTGAIERTQELGDILGAASRICTNRFVGSLCKVVELKAFVALTGGGEWTYEKNVTRGGADFSDNTGLVKISGGGSATVNGGQAFAIEVGAAISGSITVGSPSDDASYLRKADVAVEGTAKVSTYLLAADYKYAFGCTFPPTVPGDIITCGKTADSLRPQPDREGPAELAINVIPPYAPREMRSASTTGAAIEDVSPSADPAAAFRDNSAIVVYLTENASVANPLHRLDVRYVRRDGAGEEWSAPKSITSDSLGEFNPTVTFRSSSEVVAVWERNRNGNLTAGDVATLDDLGKLTREVEIVAAIYDVASDRWSTPEAITNNDVWDAAPRLAALADGRVVAVWIREAADGLQEIVSRTLTASTWSAETTIARGLRGVTGVSIAASGNEAHGVFSHDEDGSSATPGDTETGVLRLRDGTWQRLADLTDDATSDLAPQVIHVGATPKAIWLREKRLVWRNLENGTIETIRDGDASLGLLDAQAIASPSGRVAIVRADLFGMANAAVAQVWDPALNRWTPDVELRRSTGRGRSVMPHFADDDTVRLVMLDTTAGGVTADRTDLVAADRRLRVDLSVASAALAVTPQEPEIGQRVTLEVTAENRGDLPVRDVVVNLYGGRNDAGSPIATSIASGDWLPGEKKLVPLAFDYSPAARVVTAAIDSATIQDANPADNAATYSFANRTPAPCFQASVLSGPAPLDVKLDASCSSDADGTVASYSWNIGSGAATAAGRTASHRFSEPGSHPVTLVVSDDMGARSSRTVTVEVGGGDMRPATTTHSLYLPVAGRAPGAGGAYFVSDLDVLNTDAEELEIEAVFLPSGRSDTFAQRFTLGGGELLRTRDVLAQMFSAANGTGSIRLDLSHPHAVAAARTYNDQPTGTAGFSNSALRASEALSDGEKGVILQQILPGYRANLGFMEIGGKYTEVTLTAYDEGGTRLGEELFAIGAYQHLQFNSPPLLQKRGRVELAVRGGAVIAYASTVDGRSGDPIYQAPQRPPSAGVAETLMIPVVARLAGANGSSWRSDVRVFNASSASQRVTIELRTASGTFMETRDLAAGQTAAYDDVIATLFPQVSGNVSGAMTIAGAGPLLASSRTFNLTEGGTYGLFVPARGTDDLLAAGETAYLTQVQENASYRCNLGMTATEEGGRLEVRAFDSRGETLATKEYGVPPGLNVQIGRVLADMGVPLPVEVAGLEVRVLEGRLFVYASVNDNRTGDGTFVEARR